MRQRTNTPPSRLEAAGVVHCRKWRMRPVEKIKRENNGPRLNTGYMLPVLDQIQHVLPDGRRLCLDGKTSAICFCCQTQRRLQQLRVRKSSDIVA
jgi:hypothetical protein